MGGGGGRCRIVAEIRLACFRAPVERFGSTAGGATCGAVADCAGAGLWWPTSGCGLTVLRCGAVPQSSSFYDVLCFFVVAFCVSPKYP